MFKTLIAASCAVGLLTGCTGTASKATLDLVTYYTAQCQKSGDPYTCQLAQYNRSMAEIEAKQDGEAKSALVSGIAGALIGAAIDAQQTPTVYIVHTHGRH